jgi:hypothetical protein
VIPEAEIFFYVVRYRVRYWLMWKAIEIADWIAPEGCVPKAGVFRVRRDLMPGRFHRAS